MNLNVSRKFIYIISISISLYMGEKWPLITFPTWEKEIIPSFHQVVHQMLPLLGENAEHNKWCILSLNSCTLFCTNEKQCTDLSQLQMSEQAFWLSDLTHNMADLFEQYMARDRKWKWLYSLLFHINSVGLLSDVCFMLVEGRCWTASFFCFQFCKWGCF